MIVTRATPLSSPLELLSHRPMRMKYSTGMCLPNAGHKLLCAVVARSYR